MRTFRKLLCPIVVFALLITASLPALAAGGTQITAENWNSYWESYNDEGIYLHMAPGSNESEMNFAWMGTEACDSPKVFIKQADETGTFKAFSGVTVTSDHVPASYHVTVTGLKPSTEYVYYCSVNGKATAVYSFVTAGTDKFSAIYVSDTHMSFSEEDENIQKECAFNLQELFAEAYDNHDISMIISGGDLANSGKLGEYQAHFASPVFRKVPLATSCGNHDKKSFIYPYITNNPNRYNEGKAISKDVNGGDYWYVKNNVLFLHINTNWISASDHYNFVKDAVEANPNVKWRVAVSHHDLYGAHIAHRENENKLLRAMLYPIYDEFNIDLALMGHSHVYSRSHVLYRNKIATNTENTDRVINPNGTVYITTGSATSPRFSEEYAHGPNIAFDHISGEDRIYNVIDFSEDSITFNAYVFGEDEPFDVFTIEKTSNEGGHPETRHCILTDVIGAIGTFANFFVNIGVFFQQLFARFGW